MKITILGHVCIDKNTSEHSSYTAAGSPAMFMNKIFPQLPDNQVTIITPYGEDFLEHTGDARLYPENPKGLKTLLYENITQAGVRLQKAHHREAANPVPVDTTIKKIVASSDIVFVAPLLPNFSPEYLQNVLFHTKSGTLKVLLPQGYYRDFDHEDNVRVRPFTEDDEILPLVDIVILSDQDHSDMRSLAKEWVSTHNVTAIITLGEKGAVAVTAEKETQLPTRAVPENEVVDSVGSGDIFSAGFSYRYRQTHDLKEAGRFANELAMQCLFFASNDIKIDSQKLFTACSLSGAVPTK